MAKKHKISIIPNGVNTNFFLNSQKKADIFRSKFKIDGKFILSVGRLHHIKGFDFLIKAFAQIIKEFDKLKLIIVGEDFGYKNTLISLVWKLKLEHNINFIEKLSNDLLVGAYSAASIYVQPSKFEIFGMAALEAAACETPIIVTNVGGLRNLLPKENSFIVEFNDIEKLKEICLNFLKNEIYSEEIGEKNRKLMMDFYNWNIIGTKIENIYKKILRF